MSKFGKNGLAAHCRWNWYSGTPTTSGCSETVRPAEFFAEFSLFCFDVTGLKTNVYVKKRDPRILWILR